MDSLASTALYLASSLTTVQAPDAIPPVPAAAVAIATPVARRAAGPKPVDTVAGRNPFGLVRSRDGRAPSDVIAETGRDDVFRPTIAADFALRAPTHDLRDATFSEDVLAEHDARIAFIRQRMEQLRLEGATTASARTGLATKLHLAMAARRLAVARDAVGRLPIDCDTGPGVDACTRTPIAVASAATNHRKPGHGRSRSTATSTSHQRAAAGTIVASTHPSPIDTGVSGRHGRADAGVRRVADTHREASRLAAPRSDRAIASSRSTLDPLARHVARHATDDTVDPVSERARRLLAKARHLLEDETGRHSQGGAGADVHGGVRLAGLLQWKGSETWSLGTRSTLTA